MPHDDGAQSAPLAGHVDSSHTGVGGSVHSDLIRARRTGTTRGVVGAFLAFVVVALALPARAAPYVDTKQRFSIELPPGWTLAPLPGDALGMVFKKSVDGVPGILRVMVRPQEPGESVKESLEKLAAPFREEIGFRGGADLPSTLGSSPSTRRTFSVYASGDAATVRAIEEHAAHVFGFVHAVHFETLERSRGAFTRDVDRMLSSYQALAGRDVVGPLVGKWDSTDDTADLTLQEDGRFALGALSGTYHVEGGALSLRVQKGEERYRYVLDGGILTLNSANLEKPKSFMRKGGAHFAAAKRETRLTPLSRDELVGRWRVVDSASTDRLVLQLAPSGSVSFGQLSGRWRFADGRLTIASTAGVTITYSASMAQGRLLLAGGDLDHDLELVLDDPRAGTKSGDAARGKH